MEVRHVEVRDKSGVLTARVRIGAAPVSFGRAADNAVEIPDDYADAFHLRAHVCADGSGVVVADLGTVNGTRIGDRLIKGEEAAVAFGEPIGIGESTLTFVSRSTSVPEAKLLERPAARAAWHERIPLWRTMGVLLVSMSLAFWLLDYEAMGLFGIVGIATFVIVLTLGWAGLWATGSRLAVGVWHFRKHLAFTALWVLVLVPTSAALGWVAFALGSRVIDGFVNWVLLGVGAWSLVYSGHIDIASRRGRRYNALLAAGLMSVTMVLVIGVGYVDPTPPEVIQRSLRTIYPVPAGLTRTESLDAFLQRATALEEAHEDDVASGNDDDS